MLVISELLFRPFSLFDGRLSKSRDKWCLPGGVAKRFSMGSKY